MSINITINIPNEEISDGKTALEKRMAVLGYAFGAKAVPVIPQIYDGPHKNTLTGSDAEPAVTLEEAIRAEEAKEDPKAEPAKRTRKPKEEKPQISTSPENRVEPDAVDDTATAEADAADEAAEVEAAREPEKPLTIEDVKKAVGLYVSKFGLAETQADGPALFVAALGQPPAGEGMWKMSLLSGQDQATLAKAIKAWEDAAAAEKRFGA